MSKPDVRYARFHEAGKPPIEPKPFLQPASNSQHFAEDIFEMVKKVAAAMTVVPQIGGWPFGTMLHAKSDPTRTAMALGDGQAVIVSNGNFKMWDIEPGTVVKIAHEYWEPDE